MDHPPIVFLDVVHFRNRHCVFAIVSPHDQNELVQDYCHSEMLSLFQHWTQGLPFVFGEIEFLTGGKSRGVVHVEPSQGVHCVVMEDDCMIDSGVDHGGNEFLLPLCMVVDVLTVALEAIRDYDLLVVDEGGFVEAHDMIILKRLFHPFVLNRLIDEDFLRLSQEEENRLGLLHCNVGVEFLTMFGERRVGKGSVLH